MPETIEAPPEVVPHQPADPAFVRQLDKMLGKKEGEQQKPEEPAMWAVVLHNDNTTFPDFVTEVLMEAFRIEGNSSKRIMMHAHRTGQAVVTVTTKERAETMLHAAEAMVAKAEAGKHFYSHVASCELAFSLREESSEKGKGGG